MAFSLASVVFEGAGTFSLFLAVLVTRLSKGGLLIMSGFNVANKVLPKNSRQYRNHFVFGRQKYNIFTQPLFWNVSKSLFSNSKICRL
jgi:hypothetical protein